MEIENLAHILRAAKSLTGETIFVVVGSQAILASHHHPPEALRMSMEADIWPKHRPDLAEVIEGAMGADSPFHGAFGYHADGIGPETALLPDQWEARAVRFEGHPLLEGAEAFCPEIHDLCASKLIAFREKDRDWVAAACAADLADPSTIAERLDEIKISDDDPIDRGSIARAAKAWLEHLGRDEPESEIDGPG